MLCEVRAGEKQQSFRALVSETVSSAFIADSLRLHQIPLNLLSYALKCTPDQGTFMLPMDVDEDSKKYQILCIRLADTGIGMSRQFMQKMGARRQRGSGNRSAHIIKPF